jgi:hypothetical protein
MRLHPTAAGTDAARPRVSRRRYTDRARKTSARFPSGQVEASRRASRRLAASSASGNPRRPSPRQRSDPGRGNDGRERVWLLRASGSFGSGRRQVRSIGLSRAAARRRGADGGHSCQRSLGARGCLAIAPSSRASSWSSSSPVSAPVGSAPLLRVRRTSWHSRAAWLGDRLFEGPYNTALEPAAFSSRAFVGATGRRGSARSLGGRMRPRTRINPNEEQIASGGSAHWG